jgi:hypothetical protein
MASIDKLDLFLLERIYLLLDLVSQYNFSATCRQARQLKSCLRELEVDERMTDVSLRGLTGVCYLDCGLNMNLTDQALIETPNVTHLCLGYNQNITPFGIQWVYGSLYSVLPEACRLKLLQPDHNQPCCECLRRKHPTSVKVNLFKNLRLTGPSYQKIKWKYSQGTAEYRQWKDRLRRSDSMKYALVAYLETDSGLYRRMCIGSY